MYQLGEPPSAWCAEKGGVRAGRSVVRLFPGAQHALREIVSSSRFAETRIALASSTSEPGYARDTLSLLRLHPHDEDSVLAKHVAFAELYPIAVKTAHFSRLQKSSGIPYSEMLFFDDCNWSDNVGEVMAACPGVIGCRTPNGLTVELWEEGLRLFAEAALRRMSSAAP